MTSGCCSLPVTSHESRICGKWRWRTKGARDDVQTENTHDPGRAADRTTRRGTTICEWFRLEGRQAYTGDDRGILDESEYLFWFFWNTFSQRPSNEFEVYGKSSLTQYPTIIQGYEA